MNAPHHAPHRDRPRRGDAHRNRQRLLDAAGILVGARGTDVPLDEIARTAGLSSGTLYRNFASRADLLRAMYDVLVDRLDLLVERVLAAPSGWEAITTYVDGVVAIADAHPELGPVFAYMRGNEPGYRPGDHWVAPAQEIAARAHGEGSLRADATATDLTYVPHLLVPLARWREPQRGVLLARMRAVLLDGLRRHDHHEPLPRQPLGVADLRAAAFSGVVPG